ncbi:hypothetical protein [Cerasicoccus fimbriatus]|uniref:hypothetical protein n=1 Tax=Cerasicoccus fimbriatus TaxID=3014554 RepID=UPI0022B2C460|nr:hypothetical protein [Cerasicoccus sp. TK19100]
MQYLIITLCLAFILSGCRGPSKPTSEEIKQAFVIDDLISLKVEEIPSHRLTNKYSLFHGQVAKEDIIWAANWSAEKELQNDIGIIVFKRDRLMQSSLFSDSHTTTTADSGSLTVKTRLLGFGAGGAVSGSAFQSSNGRWDVLILLSEDYENPNRPKGAGWNISQKGIEVAPKLDELL